MFFSRKPCTTSCAVDLLDLGEHCQLPSAYVAGIRCLGDRSGRCSDSRCGLRGLLDEQVLVVGRSRGSVHHEGLLGLGPKTPSARGAEDLQRLWVHREVAPAGGAGIGTGGNHRCPIGRGALVHIDGLLEDSDAPVVNVVEPKNDEPGGDGREQVAEPEPPDSAVPVDVRVLSSQVPTADHSWEQEEHGEGGPCQADYKHAFHLVVLGPGRVGSARGIDGHAEPDVDGQDGDDADGERVVSGGSRVGVDGQGEGEHH